MVLAEPGAGKTRLLEVMADRLGVIPQKASIFRNAKPMTPGQALILDALDEVAKKDQSAIDEILVKAQESGARTVLLASRSSEWDESRSVFVKDCFGAEPRVVRLKPLNLAEQDRLFLCHCPEEEVSVSAFRKEIQRFNLEPLLGNPQFLKLLADAYVGSERKFETRTDIFDHAIKRFAQETNPAVPQSTRPPIDKIVSCANEVFAILLLSGAVGISTSEELDQCEFPFLNAVMPDNGGLAHWLIDTRLLKPSSREGWHEPVHRMVAEYCAAHYLTGRVEDAGDAFSLPACLAIMAPNSFVRDDLRGLFGWMASVGGKAIQEATIKLDPYSVLANGDPSRLLTSSKKALLTRLAEVAEINPYFRGADFGRTFGTTGFFTSEIVKIVRPMLLDPKTPGNLRDLLLEMLHGSGAVSKVITEMRTLMLDPEVDEHTRVLAYENLESVESPEHGPDDLDQLLAQDSFVALEISAYLVRDLGVESLGLDRVLKLVRAHVRLVESSPQQGSRHSWQRIAFRKLIDGLERSHTERLLDGLTHGLICTCGVEYPFNCHCRDAVSKVTGRVLDRYFKIAAEPLDPGRIWQWVRNLNFHNPAHAGDSASVRVLQADDELRQGIHRHVLNEVTDPDQIFKIRRYSFERQAHAGLSFRPGDNRAIADHAFRSDNPNLWASFIPDHHRYMKPGGPDVLRAHMRSQANLKPGFMRRWSKRDRASRIDLRASRKDAGRWSRRRKRRDARAERNKAANLKYLERNRLRIESGADLNWLQAVARPYLDSPKELGNYVDDPALPERALINCLPYLKEKPPALEEIAELHCRRSRTIMPWEQILWAACLVVFRQSGSLNSINRDVLAILKTEFDVAYQNLDEQFRECFEAELNRCLFRNECDLRSFAHQYLQPQLGMGHCRHPRVDWLRYKPEFESLRKTLPLNWLKQFPGAPINALDTLFDLAAGSCSRADMANLISLHSGAELTSTTDQAAPEDSRKRRDFWRLREFVFLDDIPDEIMQWLKSEPDLIFDLNDRFGSLSHANNRNWPELSARKILLILDAYVDAWPKVGLPQSWGTSSPRKETAYRFLRDVFWKTDKDLPVNRIAVLKEIIADDRFREFHDAAHSMLIKATRDRVLMEFRPPSPVEIYRLLHKNLPVTVEGLRALMREEIEKLQQYIRGSEFDLAEKFYSGGERVDETTASKRIAEHLQNNLAPKGMDVSIEHQLHGGTRCDIAAAKMFDGTRKLVVIEVKGQWHVDLFTAAAEQLDKRYAIHPDAAQQGLYLVLWFGGNEKIAGKRNSPIVNPCQLSDCIIAKMPEDLRKRIDVCVLDVSQE